MDDNDDYIIGGWDEDEEQAFTWDEDEEQAFTSTQIVRAMDEVEEFIKIHSPFGQDLCKFILGKLRRELGIDPPLYG